MNPTAVKEAIKNNFPINKLVGVWWASGDDDARAGGPEAKGYKSLNLNAAGTNFPVIQDIQKFVVDKGKSLAPKEKVGENLYNRGVYNSMLLVEGIRNAQRITGKKVITGEDMRRGLESLNITEARLKEIGMEASPRRPRFPAPTIPATARRMWPSGTARNGPRRATGSSR